MFTPIEIEQLRDILNLPTTELRSGSYLRSLLDAVVQNDTRYNTTIEDTIKSYISEIAALELKIIQAYNAGETVKSETVSGEYSVTYQSTSRDSVAYLQKQRQDLIKKLKRDLGLRSHTGIAWRTRS